MSADHAWELRQHNTDAAGALRSACINSPINKRELNRVNGIAALVEAVRTGTTRCKEQVTAPSPRT
eukprot:3588020-Rhodomonas_salina.1